MTRVSAPADVRSALDASLPPGLDVVEVVEASPGSSLADRLEASVYEIRLAGVTVGAAQAAVQRLLASEQVEIGRMTKNGLRRFDARGPVERVDVLDGRVDRGGEAGSEPCAILRVVVRHTTPAVRPDDVLEALRQVADLAPPVPPQVTRLAQGPLDLAAGGVSDPLVQDRD